MLFKLIDSDSEGSSKLVDKMRQRMKEPEKRKNMPNLISHLYWSLAQLEINDEAIMSEIEKCIKQLIPELELKNLVTLLEGLGKRRKERSNEEGEESLVSLLHKRFSDLYDPSVDSDNLSEADMTNIAKIATSFSYFAETEGKVERIVSKHRQMDKPMQPKIEDIISSLQKDQ